MCLPRLPSRGTSWRSPPCPRRSHVIPAPRSEHAGMDECPLHQSAPACPLHAEKHGTHECDCPTIGCSQTDAGFMALFGAVGILPTAAAIAVPVDAGDAALAADASAIRLAPVPLLPPPRSLTSVSLNHWTGLKPCVAESSPPSERYGELHEIRGIRLPVRHLRLRRGRTAGGAGDDQLRDHQRACHAIRRVRSCRAQV